MKKIVIAGGGFGGLRCALQLNKDLGSEEDVKITVVDRNPYHVAHAFLYEVATSPEELTSLTQLKQSVTVPIADVVAGTGVEYRQASLEQIDPSRRELQLDHGKLQYDYLVLALGSDPNYYGIPGAEQHSITMRSVRDAFAIRNRIQFLLDSRRMDMTKQTTRLVVAGGGFAGVEVAAELKGLLDFLAWKEQYPRHKLEIMVVEGTNQLMPGLGEQVGIDVYNRLRGLGIEIRLNSMITLVDDEYVEFSNGEKLRHDCLIWTAGVKGKEVPFTEPVELDRGKRIVTSSTLAIPKFPEIFALGDQGCFIDKNGKPLPSTARQAIDQGKYVGRAITKLLWNHQPEPYQCKSFGYIVPLGGKWAIFKSSGLYLKGIFPYWMRQVAWIHYFWTILSLRRAIQLVMLENKLYERND